MKFNKKLSVIEDNSKIEDVKKPKQKQNSLQN